MNIYPRGVFRFAEHQEYGLGYELTMQKSDNVVFSHEAGVEADPAKTAFHEGLEGVIHISYFGWFFPQFIPNVFQQKVTFAQTLSGSATELAYYIGCSHKKMSPLKIGGHSNLELKRS